MSKRENEGAVVSVDAKKQRTAGALVEGVNRTSDLAHPNLRLTGHSEAVLTCKFAPNGDTFASGSWDKKIFLWQTFEDNNNFAVLKGHNNAVLELHYSTDSSTIFSCGADKTAQIFDLESLTRIKKIKAHEGVVNSCCPTRRGTQMLATGSDDGTCKIWDMRTPRRPAAKLELEYPITSVQFSDQADQLYLGTTTGVIDVYELRKNTQLYSLQGHTDIITGGAVSEDGNYLLSNSMDNTVRCWDVRPFVKGGDSQRSVKVFGPILHGSDKNLLKPCWSPDGSRIAAGSCEHPPSVWIWDFATRKYLYKLAGHKGVINEVAFHPVQPIVLSCSSDKTLLLGELAK
eukprot:TRINITY_DN68372_c0_g1_i1.p1 TRINITY_DN68372_c0_g1~~TRINITY_DN68372_c0_g1_i1.p1  ORF type:complete len:354 (-),score=23.90 TRINITY_DN68372_c0_g1_i1:53-1084(-)